MSINVRAGAATIDITPPAGLAMSGFGARTAPALGAHDPLTARAVAVDDTAIVCADVVGLHEDSCARIRERCCLPAGNVVVTALHTHGGPVSMPGRLGAPLDRGYLACLEDACVRAVDRRSPPSFSRLCSSALAPIPASRATAAMTAALWTPRCPCCGWWRATARSLP
jgi:neutral ceramidase